MCYCASSKPSGPKDKGSKSKKKESRTKTEGGVKKKTGLKEKAKKRLKKLKQKIIKKFVSTAVKSSQRVKINRPMAKASSEDKEELSKTKVTKQEGSAKKPRAKTDSEGGKKS